MIGHACLWAMPSLWSNNGSRLLFLRSFSIKKLAATLDFGLFPGQIEVLFLIISTLTRYLGSTYFEISWRILSPFLGINASYLWMGKHRSRASHSFLSSLYAMLYLTWDLLRKASSDNRKFTMWYCLSSPISHLMLDPPTLRAPPCTRILFTIGTPPQIRLSVKR